MKPDTPDKEFMTEKMQMGIIPGIALPPSPVESIDLDHNMENQDDAKKSDYKELEDLANYMEQTSSKQPIPGRKRGKSCVDTGVRQELLSPRERPKQESVIIVEIKTNVIVS